MIERSLKISENAVGGGTAPAHRFGILVIEGRDVCPGSRTGAPAPGAFRDRTMPIEQTPRGQLDHAHVAELGKDILSSNALDAVGGLASAAAIIRRCSPPSRERRCKGRS